MPRLAKLFELTKDLRGCLPAKNRTRVNRILMQYDVIENLDKAIKNIKEEKHGKG